MVHRLKKQPYTETKRLLKKQDYSVVDTIFLTTKGETTLFMKDGKPTQKLFDYVGDYPLYSKYRQIYSTSETLDVFESTIAGLVSDYLTMLERSEFHAELVDINGLLPATPIYNFSVDIKRPIVTVNVNLESEIELPQDGCINILRGNQLLLSILTTPSNRVYSASHDLSDLFKAVILSAKR